MYRTAESVSPKHPDKVCDRISDAILDECLRQDPYSRVAIETMGGHGIITVTGELTTKAYINVRDIVTRIAGDKYGVQTNIVKQSLDIAQGVDIGGAGDQGIMIGYACRDNEEMMPQEYYLARDLCKYLYERYEEDGKTQITLNDDGKIIDIVVSFNNVKKGDLWSITQDWLGLKLHQMEDEKCNFHINSAGDWSVGSFDADAGLTGRKIVCDAYGPNVPVGGGAFSGKDPSKVDRSGAYYARSIAVGLLKQNKNFDNITVKLAFAIGIKEPVDFSYTAYQIEQKSMVEINLEKDTVTVKKMIEELDLKSPFYEQTAEWGAFGNKFNWDK